MTKILALDLSTVSTGWIVIENSKIIKDAYGTINPPKKLKGGAKLNWFEEQLEILIKNQQPDLVCVESIFKGPSQTTFKSLSMYRGVAINTIYRLTKQDPLSILAVQARATLQLSQQKDDAFKEAIKKYKLKGFDFQKDNDIIDAFILGRAIETMIKDGADIKHLQLENKPKKKKKGKKK